ncbi:MAG: phenylalanine--tRNA ligase subunit beta [Bacteroidota bacterium]
MNLSLNWLRDYVDVTLSPEALSDLLTMAGLEVDGIETTGPSLDGVIVGHVLDVQPHPNADRLRVCSVRLGPEAEEVVQIVCGAPNVAAGQRVPVATVGTTLMLPPRDGDGDRQPVKIRKGKIRGEVSRGMICAEDELGLGDDHDGILVLETDAAPGTPLAEVIETPGDVVYDIAITPNRPDATSHIGIARDVAALTDSALTVPEADVPEVGGETAERITVEIEDEAGCPRYVGMLITGVTVAPSPAWLADRLEAIGVRPINNVVDVTNYVLHEMGQPLHAFDLAHLAGETIVVRASRPGETITTLDDEERKLPEGTVLICDAEKPVAVGGVMGGANSEVSDATTDVLLESAYFDPARIRSASKALGLQTDASYRFERGIDPTGQARAAARAAAMIAEVAGGTVASGLVDAHPVPHTPTVVTLRPERARTLIGAEIEDAEMAMLLRAIGFTVEDAEADALDAFAEEALASGYLGDATEAAEHAGLRVTVPPFRPDVTREVDVIEEVARLWGYDNVPTPRTAPVALVPGTDDPADRLLAGTRRQLAALGFRELFTNSLVPSETAATYAGADWTGAETHVVETLNPISQEIAAMRPSLLHGLVNTAAYNQKRGAMALRFFESGHVYARSADASQPVEGFAEHTALSIAISGTLQPQTWDQPAREADIYDLKGVVQAVLREAGVSRVQETPRREPTDLTAYALELHVGKVRLGILARVSDAITEAADLSAPVFAAELDWDAVARVAKTKLPRYQQISRFPTVERDLALVVDAAQPVGPLADTIRRSGGGLLQDVRLFDLYEGERIEAGKKSAAFALTFGADRTLRDKDVDKAINKVVNALERQHGAVLRS